MTPRSEQLLWIAAAITRCGQAIINVGAGGCSVPGCDCPPEPVPWSYTIGLVERAHPEVVTFGLAPVHALAVLNWVHDRDVAGARIPTGAVERFDGVPITLRPVPAQWITSADDPLGQWFAHYSVGRPRLDPPEVVQLLWADDDDRFPGELGCDPEVEAMQPRLDEQ